MAQRRRRRVEDDRLASRQAVADDQQRQADGGGDRVERLSTASRRAARSSRLRQPGATIETQWTPRKSDQAEDENEHGRLWRGSRRGKRRGVLRTRRGQGAIRMCGLTQSQATTPIAHHRRATSPPAPSVECITSGATTPATMPLAALPTKACSDDAMPRRSGTRSSTISVTTGTIIAQPNA